jgi:integrase/recombinase XerD
MTQISEAVETYLFAVSALSQHTLLSYRDKLKVFQAFCEERGVTLETLSPKVFKEFLEHIAQRINPQTKEQISGHTLSSYGRVIKVFLSWVSTYEDYIGAVKPGTLKAMRVPKLEKKLKPTFTQEEIHRLYEACKQESTKYLIDRDQAILSTLLDSGVRASELCTLKVGDVHLELEDSFITVHGKGNKWREVGLGKQARLDIHRFLRNHRKGAKPEESVFLNRMRKPFTRNGLDQMLYRLKEWAGVEKEGVRICSGTHSLRCTWITGEISMIFVI